MIGADVGTYNLVCCKRNEKNEFVYRREVNAFIEVPMKDRFVFNMMKNAVDENGNPCVPLIEWKDQGVAYALGEAAMKIAYSLNTLEVKRPMKNGCLNPKEKHAQQIMSIMLHSLIDTSDPKESLYYSIPANAVNAETDADYHNMVLKHMFDGFADETGNTVVSNPINEALALVYAELSKKAYTGIGISCLCPGTKIYTNNGIKNIEDVQEGEKVITHKGRWRNINKVITKQFSGIKTKLQIQGYTNNTDMYGFVDNHELYVKRNGTWGWIGCEEIVEGDIVGEPIVNKDKNKSQITMTICKNVTSSKEYEKLFIEDGFCCSTVQKVEQEEYEGIVYDLQVEEDHSFSGPYLTIHNCGAGMVNICFAVFGSPVFQFSLVNSGDWIDHQAAKVSGESEIFINHEKTKVDLTSNPESLVHRAIKAQYEIMIQKTVEGIKKALEDSGNKIRANHPIDIVIAGGTSSPIGFDKLFSETIKKANLPIDLGEIIRPIDPLYSVARGCLLAAEAASQD